MNDVDKTIQIFTGVFEAEDEITGRNLAEIFKAQLEVVPPDLKVRLIEEWRFNYIGSWHSVRLHRIEQHLGLDHAFTLENMAKVTSDERTVN